MNKIYTYLLLVCGLNLLNAQTSQKQALAPINDEGNNAIMLTNGNNFNNFPLVANTVAATVSNVPLSSCESELRSDVWYSVEMPPSGTLTIQNGEFLGSNVFDTVLSVYTGNWGNLTLLTCIDDDPATSSGYSKIELTRPPNETLYISTWDFGSSSPGAFKISAYDSSILANTNFETNTFKIYPNPVNDIIKFSNNESIDKLEITNILGQKVLESNPNEISGTLNISNLNSGSYFVKMFSNGKQQVLKILKV